MNQKTEKFKITAVLFFLMLFLTSCTITRVNSSLWKINQIRDGKITVYDINDDNIMDLIVSGYQKGGKVNYKSIMRIEIDTKTFEPLNGKWSDKGYSFYLDKSYQLWIKTENRKAEKVPKNFFMSQVSATITDAGNLEIMYNGRKQSVDSNKWEVPSLKIWVDDGQRLWVQEGNKKTLSAKRWKRKLNVFVNPAEEWIRGTGYKRGGKSDSDRVPLGDCVIAIDGKNLNTLWTFQANDQIDNYPTVYKDKVFFGSKDKNFYGIDLKTGKLAWRYSTYGEIHTTAAVAKDTIFFGGRDGYFYALDSETGKTKWVFKAKSSIDSSPAIYENKVFFGSWDKKFYALNAYTGKVIWQYNNLPSFIGKSSPIVHNEKVIFGTWDKQLYALDVNTGKAIWQFRTDDWIDKASPAASAGTIYIGNKAGNLYAINSESGIMKWQFKTGDAITSSPVVSKNRIYVTSRDGYLYAIAPKDGTLLWQHRTRFKIFGSPALGKNQIFVSSMGGYLEAIADTEMGRPYWPMFGGDPTHKSNYETAHSFSKKLIARKTSIDNFIEEIGLKKKS